MTMAIATWMSHIPFLVALFASGKFGIILFFLLILCYFACLLSTPANVWPFDENKLRLFAKKSFIRSLPRYVALRSDIFNFFIFSVKFSNFGNCKTIIINNDILTLWFHTNFLRLRRLRNYYYIPSMDYVCVLKNVKFIIPHYLFNDTIGR